MVRPASGVTREKARIFLHFAGVESMGDGTRKDEDEGSRSSGDAALSARLKRLGAQLDANAGRPTRTEPASPPVDSSAMARGFRLSTELVAGVFVGAVLGWFLDRALGISPWGLIVFVLLGFVAGVLNVIRGAGVGTGWPDGRPKN
jgi:ATP synthase protein I